MKRGCDGSAIEKTDSPVLAQRKYDSLCLLERQRALRSNTISLESSVIAFDFSVVFVSFTVAPCPFIEGAAVDFGPPRDVS